MKPNQNRSVEMILYINILFSSIILFAKVYFTNRIRTIFLIRELNKFLRDFNFSLTKMQKKRIHYYTIQSCITNSWFCQLRGKKADFKERRRAILTGAITPFLDDLVDSTGMQSNEIIEQINQQGKNKSIIILIIRYLYDRIIKDCNEDYLYAFKLALKAQDDSIKQLKSSKLNQDELLEITLNKGEYWTILYRSVLNNSMLQNEKNAIIALGGLMQLTNDVFDVYKDKLNNQQSIYTNTADLEPLFNDYVSLTKTMIIQFLETGYRMKDIKKTLIQILLVVSRSIICHEQLLECQKRTNNQFKIEMYSRRELICDMEKTGNILKSLKLCYLFIKNSNMHERY